MKPGGGRRRRLALLGCAVLAFSCGRAGQSPGDPAPPAAPPAPRPNIVLVYADDLGYGDVSMNGGRIHTPNIDRLAADGRRLTSFYVAAPICSPSRAALLTGLYPPDNGVVWNWNVTDPVPGSDTVLGADQITIAQVLHDSGYHTASLGKWDPIAREDVSSWPWAWGFDFSYGPVARPQGEVFFENDHETEDGTLPWELPEKYTRYALDFVREHGEPFFVYLSHRNPHEPNYPDRLTDVTTLDQSIAQLRAGLADLGVAERTLIFFTSDNGAPYSFFNVPFSGRKTTCFEGGIRVPTAVVGPGHTPAGGATDGVSGTLDLFPTFAALAGAPLPARSYPGRDIRPLLEGSSLPEGEAVCWFRGAATAVRQGPWKYQRPNKQNGFRVLLHDLSTDPAELVDLSQARPDVADRMESRLRELDP